MSVYEFRRGVLKKAELDPLWWHRGREADHASCSGDIDYTDDEWEFLKAMSDYKRRRGRPFPTWAEVLGVLKGLGYRKAAGSNDVATKTPACR